MVVDLVVDALAVHRLTRLVTKDVITAPIRDRFVEAAYVQAGRAEHVREEFGRPEHLDWSAVAEDDRYAPKLATLVTCRWCAGFYLAVAVAVARRVVPRRWALAARALTLSSAAALIAGLERD